MIINIELFVIIKNQLTPRNIKHGQQVKNGTIFNYGHVQNECVNVLIHDHEKYYLRNNLKLKALNNPCETKILHRELREGDIVNTIRIRKNIHYARSIIIPKLPKNLKDLYLALGGGAIVFSNLSSSKYQIDLPPIVSNPES
ncbi:Uncharacterized protein FWK35_00008987 [Aphis craccivora]|uniref:Uncharacterized protein n=1 Tax=Aphis craccivora TaxID=307492 RepID=A0A6G0ZH85_APHCR|nr:Uncharacterized protein FWK35_00008987 [Aphis craccivora]